MHKNMNRKKLKDYIVWRKGIIRLEQFELEIISIPLKNGWPEKHKSEGTRAKRTGFSLS
jgi:hypothetical protein